VPARDGCRRDAASAAGDASGEESLGAGGGDDCAASQRRSRRLEADSDATDHGGLVNPVDAYAHEVVSGRLPAGTYHRLACARHLTDLQRQGSADFPYVFDYAKAAKFFTFSALLKHYKGEWAGQQVQLTPFQQFRLGCIFGWRTLDGARRFTTAYNELPRKTGKSFEAAIVAVYVTFFEGEPGAEGYCLATKEKQALDVVFKDIKQLIASSGLKGRLNIRVKNIHHDASVSKLEPLGSDSDTLDGLNPHCIITDELHAFKNRGLLDVMESATGARRNPLHYQITTAGDDLVSVCGDQHEYACKILNGLLDDYAAQSFFACIAHADPEDDWTQETTWKKANPHYGISVKPNDMRKLAEKAQAIPSAAAEFQQKRLNWWVNSSVPCLSLDGWRKGQTQWTPADMLHESCYIGLDLASKLDLMCLSFVFPPVVGRASWRLLNYIWTPEETLRDRALRDRVPYPVWVDQGWLRTTPGSTLNYQVVREALQSHKHEFDYERIGYDPWHADQIVHELKTLDGYGPTQVLEVPQTYAGLSSAEARFQADVLAGLVDARGCPVTAWCASNVVNQEDGKGNIFFTKKKSRGRIDPIKAATTAIALALREPKVAPVETVAEWF
jgi:phage terminase large subunit-like protein